MKKIVVGFIVYLFVFPLLVSAVDFGDMVSSSPVTTPLTRICTQPAAPSAWSQSAPGNIDWTTPDGIAFDDTLSAQIDTHGESSIHDTAAKLVLADGNLGSADKSTGTNWGETPMSVSYGGDIWSTSLTPQDVNNQNFGFALQIGQSLVKSRMLKATQFGFQIPTNAAVVGVVVNVKRRQGLRRGPPDTMIGYVNHITMSVCYTTQSPEKKSAIPFILATLGDVKNLRVTPGSLLTIPVTLRSISEGTAFDVLVQYEIRGTDGSKQDETESISVGSKPSSPKSIRIPSEYNPGTYHVSATVLYAGQTIPDVFDIEFTVIPSGPGQFINHYFPLIITILLVCIIFSIVGVFVLTLRRKEIPNEYAEVPESDRVYYEIINDMIMQMHDSIGDRAYRLADAIAGLAVDKKTGRILSVTKDPSEVVSVLYIRYQNVFKKKLKIAPRSGSKKIENTTEVEKNLDTLEKYFRKK